MQIKDIIKECERLGFLIKQGQKCHYRVHLPNKKVITISSSPSDINAYKQILRDFKRAGFELKI